MNPVSGIVVFIMIWWVTIFCVLPIGQATQYEDDGDNKAPGAPKKVNIRQKMIWTTLISIILWVVVYFIITSDIIDFRRMALEG